MIVLFLLCGNMAASDPLKRGYRALEIYDYFQAKKMFEKSIEKHVVPAAYGLSVIYARKDNPFSNLRMAYQMITQATRSFPALSAKKRVRYQQKYGVDSLVIWNQREAISRQLYDKALAANSPDSLQHFIAENPWSPLAEQAAYARDSLAFKGAVTSGTSTDFKQFIERYPQSPFVEEATRLLQKATYVEQTASHRLIDYANFVKAYPQSPYRSHAEDKIYEMGTQAHTYAAYKEFVETFPTNKHIDKVWKLLYSACVQREYSAQSLMDFNRQFPNYPFKKKLLREYEVIDRLYYPVKREGKWGFCDRDGKAVIGNDYASAEWFSEGLAAVKVGERFGYLNKLGEVVIPPQFDDALSFHQGYAVVEINGKWGLIDREGKVVIDVDYEDLGELKNGLCYFVKEDLYGYLDSRGNVRLKPVYTDAYAFESGTAIVQMEGYYGVIDTSGAALLPCQFDNLCRYKKGYCAAAHRGHWGIIGLDGDTLLPFVYDFIGKPAAGRSILERDGQFNYVDTSGRLLFSDWMATYPEYRQLADFQNGYTKIMAEGKFNLCDTSGQPLLKKGRDNIGSYSHLIAVESRGKWGYITREGKRALDDDYDYASSFSGDYAIVKRDIFYGLIDETGRYAVPPIYESLTFLNDSTLVAKSNGEYGLLTTEGELLLPFRYAKIGLMDASLLKIERRKSVNYYSIVKRQFICKED